MSLFKAVGITLLALNLGGCATPPQDAAARAEYNRTNDPLEPTNRRIFGFNQFVDRILLKPAAKTYRTLVPEFARTLVGNVLYNAGEPVRMANGLLQGRLKDSHTIFERFFLNTTLGLGGMVDIASYGGVARVSADFGQTLYSWGVPGGPYLVLPLLGPSNPRDAVGYAVDSAAQPWGYVAGIGGMALQNQYTYSSLGATLLDERSRYLDAMDALEKGALDFYAQLRSISRQHRDAELGIKPKIDDADFD